MASAGPDSSSGPALTVAQQHYLKKELINLQLAKEFAKLSVTYNDVTGLRKFGPPFAPYDPAEPPLNYRESLAISMSYIEHYDMEFPLLRHFFSHFLVTFPFIAGYQGASVRNDDEHFWVNKVQKFYEIWKSKKISNSNDRGELSKRKLALFKMIKLLVMLYNSALKTTTEAEYQAENARLDKNLYKKLNKVLPLDQVELSLDDVLNETNYVNGLELNVVGVRRSRELKEIKSLINSFQALNFWSSKSDPVERRYARFYEFIVKVKVEATGDVYYVARRYSQFQALHRQLFRQFAGKDLPRLPSKIKASSSLDYNDEGGGGDDDSDGAEAASVDDDVDDDEDDDEDDEDDDVAAESALAIENDFANSMRAFGQAAVQAAAGRRPRGAARSTRSSVREKAPANLVNVKLPREKLRLALRGYLKEMLKIPSVRNSRCFLEFLETDRFATVTSPMEQNDINVRRQLDVMVVAQQLAFQKETIRSITALHGVIGQLKAGVLAEDDKMGLLPLFAELETKKSIAELSPPLRAFVDLSKIEIASTLYELFLANDQSLEMFKVMKRLHQYFPYKMVAALMRFTNPMAIMKKLIDLFLIQPPSFSGNGKSLLQFIFTLVLSDDVKHLNREIAALKANVVAKGARNRVLIDKIEGYMENRDDNVVIRIKKNAAKLNIDLVMSVLLNNNDLKQQVPDAMLAELVQSYRSWHELKKVHAEDAAAQEAVQQEAAAQEADAEAQASYDDLSARASLFSDLDDLFKAMIRKKDKDNLRELWDEPELTRLIRELITIFFQPLIKIFTEADIYLYIPIIKDFMNDLIALIHSYQNNYSILLSSNNNTVVRFIELLTKYENHLYTFIHNLYLSDKKGDASSKVFTKLVAWFNSFIVFLKFVSDDRPDLLLDMNALVVQAEAAGLVDSAKLHAELDKIINDINRRRAAYNEILNENPEPLRDAKGTQSKIASNWADIHKNLSSAVDMDSGDIPIASGDMDELNMELVDLDLSEREFYLDQHTDAEFLQFVHDQSAAPSDPAFNDEEDDFEILKRDTEIKKLLDPFVKASYDVLAASPVTL